MKLERLHLKNFRCFDDLRIEFDPRLTVISADNGAGKTALLDALAIGFGRYLTKLPGIAGRTSKATDLRISTEERQEPLMFLAWAARTHDDQIITWASGRRRDGAVPKSQYLYLPYLDSFRKLNAPSPKEIDEFTLSLVQAEAEQKPYFLPVIAYYGTNRAIREEVQRRRGFKKKFSRFDALAGALEPDSRFRAAFEWFNAMEDEERREREARRDFDYCHPELQVVRTAIERLLRGFHRPRTKIRPLRFVIDRLMPDGSTHTLRISQLSDGYRVVLGLTMDLARRMVQANSGLLPADMQATNPLDLPAIALIDEVDLHLHPAWQQRIVADLMRTFPNAQFILTTHSPQVLSTVRRKNIRVIGVDANGTVVATPPLAMTYGEPSGDIMHSVMGVDPQPPVAEKEDLQRLTEWVDQGRYQELSAIDLMNQLRATLGERHPQLQRLQRSIQRQEALKR
ncbi:AAA family ATPase [Verminephrobacter eiseniae]|uniref:AAA family ATPase n=1 Tax=Verminephrobacter eiseniae TaxID=364317 RepID=UPI002238940A|nr:AAA family ATPase [Verminephrobacter eiseniae]